jgi:hypothetical protein
VHTARQGHRQVLLATRGAKDSGGSPLSTAPHPKQTQPAGQPARQHCTFAFAWREKPRQEPAWHSASYLDRRFQSLRQLAGTDVIFKPEKMVPGNREPLQSVAEYGPHENNPGRMTRRRASRGPECLRAALWQHACGSASHLPQPLPALLPVLVCVCVCLSICLPGPPPTCRW